MVVDWLVCRHFAGLTQSLYIPAVRTEQRLVNSLGYNPWIQHSCLATRHIVAHYIVCGPYQPTPPGQGERTGGNEESEGFCYQHRRFFVLSYCYIIGQLALRQLRRLLMSPRVPRGYKVQGPHDNFRIFRVIISTFPRKE